MDVDYETARLLQEEFQHEFFSSPKENLSDSIIARQLQEQFEQETSVPISRNNGKLTDGISLSDSMLARTLQDQFQQEEAVERPGGNLAYDTKKRSMNESKSLVDPSWEVIDPTPDIHVLFMAFNNKFFWGRLDSVCVSWSTKMKRCAGVCSYQGYGGLCHITLSEPLLKLRPRKDLIETLLHEMIHAFLFVTNNNRDRDGHGPEFHKHMYRINVEAGTNITVYHDFHDEVELYLQHWWRCDGPCQKWKPYFGIVRRSANRAPGPNDRWWGEHTRNCGGIFVKIKSPETKESKKAKQSKSTQDIRKFLPTTGKAGSSRDSLSSSINRLKPHNNNTNIHLISKPTSGLSTSVTIPSNTNNIHGFSNFEKRTGGVKGATKNASNTILINKKPSKSTFNKENNAANKSSKSNNPSIFSSGKKEDMFSGTPENYSVVRNHWLNKFSGSSSNSSNKRKIDENVSTTSKVPKLSSGSSQDSLDFDGVPCPVCNISFPIYELNEHLDTCLNNSENSDKECIVCSKKIQAVEFENHVNECLKINFDDDEDSWNEVSSTSTKNDSVILLEKDSMDMNSKKCSICENEVSLDHLDEHLKICSNRTKCPECGNQVDQEQYDIHLAECLMKKLDEIDERYSGNDKNEINKTEMVDCLACGKNILKSNLNSHLDDCLNGVFNNDTMKKEQEENDDMYNCPFCLKLVSEEEMSDHIDNCLKVVDDEEAERNKTIF
ncbi:hypothetical protein HHI36_018442 [Cryptolaemus montrouzieri]|uniref:Protein with SprT-like domain at the N terminus n=1 Tax=Cryptolaemus montrouzieri TaxID=559131 RepID=A0ABD2P073_9CUCU